MVKEAQGETYLTKTGYEEWSSIDLEQSTVPLVRSFEDVSILEFYKRQVSFVVWLTVHRNSVWIRKTK